MTPERNWSDMTAERFRQADTSHWIAVLPVAATEQHGPHLPVSTDATIAEGMLRRVLDLLPHDIPATFLPVQRIGKSNEHITAPGTLTFSAATYQAMLMEIGDSIKRAGINKLVMINSHGGNVPVLTIVARDLRVAHGMLAVTTSWGGLGYPDDLLSKEEMSYGIHGGDSETSLMLHLRPDHVDMKKADDFRTSQIDMIAEFKHLRLHGQVQTGWLAQDLHPAGVAGDATNASADKGAAVVEWQAQAFCDLLGEVDRFTPEWLGQPATT